MRDEVYRLVDSYMSNGASAYEVIGALQSNVIEMAKLVERPPQIPDGAERTGNGSEA